MKAIRTALGGDFLEEIDAAVAALVDRIDVTVLDGPHTNDEGPTAGLTYVYCRVEWGLYLELLEAPSWMFRPKHSE